MLLQSIAEQFLLYLFDCTIHTTAVAHLISGSEHVDALDVVRRQRLREQIQRRHLAAEHRVELHVLSAADEAAVKHLSASPQ